MKVKKLILPLAGALLLAGGLLLYRQLRPSGASVTIIGGADGPTAIYVSSGDGEASHQFECITMQEAQAVFETPGDYIILDVRRADEFAAGHIPGAVNVANESITDTPPAELPDKTQTIYVYCRSGNRSKQAAAKLAAMGYTGIIECGGITDWTGAVER